MEPSAGHWKEHLHLAPSERNVIRFKDLAARLLQTYIGALAINLHHHGQPLVVHGRLEAKLVRNWFV